MPDESQSSQPIVLPSDPVTATQAGSKGYIDGQDALRVARSGDAMTGPLFLPVGSVITAAHQVPTKAYVDGADAVHTHPASSITSAPSGSLAATNVQAALVELQAEKVAKEGDTMTGYLTLNANPFTGLQATTKSYADLQGTLEMPIDISGLPYEAVLTHNLGRKPTVSVQDNQGNTGFADWTYDALNPLTKLTVRFSYGFTGKAILT